MIIKLFNTLVIIFFVSLLFSCQGDPEKQGFTLSGKITAAQGTDIDSDVNDFNNPFSENNTPAQAQALSSPLTLAGYLTHQATNDTKYNDIFANSADREDHFLVKLFKGEVITLEISDWQANNNIDFSLAFFPVASTNSSEQISDGSNRFEQLIVPENGNYRIVVTALAGASNYSLSIGSLNSPKYASTSTQNHFVDQQFIYTPPTQASLNKASFRQANNTIDDEALQRLAMVHVKGQKNHHQLLASHPLSSAMARSQQVQSSQFKLSEQTQTRYNTLLKLKELKRNFGDKAMSLNYRYQAQHIPNDPMYFMQWHYPLISLPSAWQLVKEHSDIETDTQYTPIVAVIDTGVFLNHEDLKNQLVPGYDFIADDETSNDNETGIDNNPDDPGDSIKDDSGRFRLPSSWHGTHVAGIIAGETDNNIGIAGIGINTKVMPIRVLGVNDGTTYDIIQGLKFAAGLDNDSNTLPARKADIINMSLGGTSNDPAMQDVIEQITEQNNNQTIIVAAAGNNASASQFYPAAYPEVFSISAVGANKQAAPYSNYGSTIDLAAPGGDQSVDLNSDGQNDGILSTLVTLSGGDERQSAYEYYQGTSMATPHVAGVFALMKSIYPKLSQQELQNLLLRNKITDDLGTKGKDIQYGHGLINAYKAVYEAKALASGGDLPPMLVSSVNHVYLELNSQQQLITLSQIGDSEALSINDIIIDAPWLSFTASDPSQKNELGLYLLSAETKDLSDGLYSGLIKIIASNNTSTELNISLRVDRTQNQNANANTGALYLFLVDSSNRIAAQSQPLTAINGEYHYSFSRVEAGYYYLQAGSDIDNDYKVCDLGESCAAWPILAEPQLIHVNGNLTNINFTSYINSVIYQASNSNKKVMTYQRQENEMEGRTLEAAY